MLREILMSGFLSVAKIGCAIAVIYHILTGAWNLPGVVLYGTFLAFIESSLVSLTRFVDELDKWIDTHENDKNDDSAEEAD